MYRQSADQLRKQTFDQVRELLTNYGKLISYGLMVARITGSVMGETCTCGRKLPARWTAAYRFLTSGMRKTCTV